MRSAICGGVLLVAAALGGQAKAQGCGGSYVVQTGETLSMIAERYYQDAGKWTVIQSANLDQIGSDPNTVRAGMRLHLRCINGLPVGLDAATSVTVKPETATSAARAVGGDMVPGQDRITILTGSDLWPFADKSLPEGGMLTEVVRAAMGAANPAQGFAIHWIDDWSAHQDPLLSNRLLDIGFPWPKPDCTTAPEVYGCVNLLFSAPMFEMLILLFVDRTRPISFHSAADLQGKTLCQPAGLDTALFEQQGRNWLEAGVITLETPATAEACLSMLVEGTVDGVVLNEFQGRRKVKDLGLEDRVMVADGQPISVDGAHLVVHKSHPDGQALLAVFNRGLEEIRANGTYQQIIDAHMTRVWAGL